MPSCDYFCLILIFTYISETWILFFFLDENEEPKEIEIVAVFKTLTERIKDTISNIVMSDNFLIQLCIFSCLNQDYYPHIITLIIKIKQVLFLSSQTPCA